MLDKDFYTPKEIAELLRVDVQTVRKYIREGKIKTVRLNGKMQRIARAEVDYLFKTTKGENK